jgi:hypothetical protein
MVGEWLWLRGEVCPEGMGGRGREEPLEQRRAPARQSYGIRVLSQYQCIRGEC